MELKRKCILLVRVSTDAQDLAQQTDKVKSQALSDGYTEDSIIVIEDKESAVKLSEEERNGLNRLKMLIDNDTLIDCVYSYEISRISRQAKIVYSIRDYLISHKVQLVILNPFFKMLKDDMSLSETSNIFFGIFASMAENEGFIRKARCTRGQLKAKMDGRIGTGSPLFGYKTVNKKIVIDTTKADIVRKIYSMYLDGYSYRSIYNYLKDSGDISATDACGAKVIHNILRDKRYCGRKHEKYMTVYPAIVTDELFDRCQSIASSKVRKSIRSNNRFTLLQGMVFGVDGRKLSPNSTEYLNGVSTSGKNKRASINIDVCDKLVTDDVKEYVNKTGLMQSRDSKLDELGKQKSRIEKCIATGNKRIEALSSENDRINERVIKGKMSELKADKMIDANNMEISNIEYSNECYAADINKIVNEMIYVGSILYNNDSKIVLDGPADIREMIVKYVEKIVVENVKYGHKTVTIHYKSGELSQYNVNRKQVTKCNKM